jgi:class 3 adenylate cyclase
MARLSARERASLPDRAFAYIDSAGVRRLPVHDAAHVRSALSRFVQVRFETDEARDLARARLLNAAKKHGVMPVGFMTSQLRKQRPALVLPSGNVTFLLLDIEGSTAHLQRLGDGYADVLRSVRKLVDTAVATYGGVKVDATGDEYFAVFRTPRDAITAAVAIQLAMAAGPWPGDVPVLLRAGVHGGRPTLTESGYVGLAVHTVARICSVAHGGQVVVSDQVRAALADPADLGETGGLGDGMSLLSLGPQRLAGLTRDEVLYQLVAQGLLSDFPPLRIVGLSPG